jgi:CBS domain-containing protein
MRTIVSIDSKAKVKDAARMMVEKRIGSLVANRDGLPFGIITERDLVEKIAAEGVDPAKTAVSEVMTAPLTTIDASANIVDAARRMVEKRVKRLVVTDQDKIVGIVSQTDIVSHITDFQKLARMGMT